MSHMVTSIAFWPLAHESVTPDDKQASLLVFESFILSSNHETSTCKLYILGRMCLTCTVYCAGDNLHELVNCLQNNKQKQPGTIKMCFQAK